MLHSLIIDNSKLRFSELRHPMQHSVVKSEMLISEILFPKEEY